MRRRRGTTTALAALTGAALLGPVLLAGPAVAEPRPSSPPSAPPSAGQPPAGQPEVVTGVPTQEQVAAAAVAVQAASDDVATVQAALAAAQEWAQRAAIESALATESYHQAFWRARRTLRAADAAQAAAEGSHASVQVQRRAYADAITSGYTIAPSLGALGAIATSDGIGEVIEKTATLHNAEQALDERHQDLVVNAALSEAISVRADQARDDARRAAREADRAREAAQLASDAATARSSAMSAQRDSLLGRLAELQDQTLALTTRRQEALETRSSRAELRAALREAREAGGDAPLLDDPTGPRYGDPIPVPVYDPLGPFPVVPSGPPPKPGRGAKYAIAFARAQIGEPYVWAAAGPDAWDCSGLTMGAWANGAKTLPHYSVAQYARATPIRPEDLEPGDLVFWGRTNDPSTIYHVALYSGGGRIIQAPRTGVPVQEVAMSSWTAPNFYARP